jgi:hypothetical protein
MSSERDQHRQAPEHKDEPAAPGAATAPAEAHREAPPGPVECAQCRTLIPRDAALVPEGLDYVLYFCSPGCHEAWERARADAHDND